MSHHVKAGGRLGQQAGVKLDQRKNWEVGEEVALKEGVASGAKVCAVRRV
jgi:hypothetical protein